MAYADTLSNLIKASGLTLQQISIKCKHYGEDVSHSYLSKLQNGKQAPPTDKVSEAIARACGGDPEILLYEGYLEKAPEFIQNLLQGLAHFARQSTKILTLPQLAKPVAAMFEEHLNQIPDVVLVKQFVENDILDQLSSTMILRDFEDKDVKVMTNPLLTIPMPDDSMEPTIPVGSKLSFSDPTDLKNGDIVAARIDDQTHVVRNLFISEASIILTPLTKGYEPIVFPKSENRIFGKITSVTISL